jgi:hypothetical protein
MGRERECIPEQTCSLSGKPSSLACDGNVLTRESSTNKVNVSHEATLISPLLRCHHVVMLRHVRPMLVKYGPCVLVDLYLADTRPADVLKPQIESADPGEQGHEPHRSMS